LVEYLTELRDSDWKRRLGGSRKSWKRFCIDVLGYPSDYFDEIETGVKVLGGKPNVGEAQKAGVAEMAKAAQPLLKHGRPEKDKGVDNTFVRGSTNADYLTRRIARDRPDILARMKAGEFPSVRAAAIEAGIVKRDTPLVKLTRAWNAASEVERAEFMRFVKNGK
jgi:hypothetical protein